MRCGQAVVKDVEALRSRDEAGSFDVEDTRNFFEDYRVGQTIAHAVPRTVTEGDRALYTALYPTRFAL